MALYLAIKDNVIAMIHRMYLFILRDPPPRFYILLVLISILLIILAKAGVFDEEISAINGIIYAGNSREVADEHRKWDKIEKIDINEDEDEDEDDDADRVDVSKNESCPTVWKDEKIDINEDEDEDDADRVDVSKNESCPTVWKDENYGKDQEDIEQLHKRVEDFIRRGRMRFHLEHTTVASIPCT